MKQSLNWKLSLTVDWKLHFSPFPPQFFTLVVDFSATPLAAQEQTFFQNFLSDFFSFYAHEFTPFLNDTSLYVCTINAVKTLIVWLVFVADITRALIS